MRKLNIYAIFQISSLPKIDDVNESSFFYVGLASLLAICAVAHYPHLTVIDAPSVTN